MSRYEARSTSPEHYRVLIGWDQALCTFYLDVIDLDRLSQNVALESESDQYWPGDSEWHRLIDALEETVICRRGTVVQDLPSIASLADAMAPWAGFEPGQVKLLIHDKRRSRPPSPMQRAVSRTISSLVTMLKMPGRSKWD